MCIEPALLVFLLSGHESHALLRIDDANEPGVNMDLDRCLDVLQSQLVDLYLSDIGNHQDCQNRDPLLILHFQDK
jgi:hypothetical protein